MYFMTGVVEQLAMKGLVKKPEIEIIPYSKWTEEQQIIEDILGEDAQYIPSPRVPHHTDGKSAYHTGRKGLGLWFD